MKIPAAILVILAEQERQLARVNPRHRAQLMAIGSVLAAELEAALKKLRPGKYTTTETRTVLTQITAMLEVLAVKFGIEVTNVVEAVHMQGAKRGRKSLVEQLAVWDSEGLLPDVGAHTEATAELLDPGLLELHEASRKAYGEEVIAKMRMTVARGQMAGETIAQTAERIEKDLQIPDWRAERIVRTEHSLAFNRRQILDLIDTFGDEAESEWGKQLLAVRDNRTGRDSLFVDGQTQRLMDPFWDGVRYYQHPPNRPNDRESMIFVPMSALKRFEDLAKDPAHGGAIGPKSRREAQVALGMERQGRLSPTVVRSSDPRGDFVDADGQLWDVKKFTSYPRPGELGGYELGDSIRKIMKDISKGEKVIVDTVELKLEHLEELRGEVDRLGIGDHVQYYP